MQDSSLLQKLHVVLVVHAGEQGQLFRFSDLELPAARSPAPSGAARASQNSTLKSLTACSGFLAPLETFVTSISINRTRLQPKSRPAPLQRPKLFQ